MLLGKFNLLPKLYDLCGELSQHINDIKLFSPQRREGRREIFSYSLPLILPKYRRTGRAAKNKKALFL
jgi:hypothetical protein